MKIKEFFIKFSILIPFSTNFLLKKSKKKVIFPFYHSVSDIPSIYIKHLYYEKSVKEFAEDLDFLLKYFTPISINELILMKENELPFSRSCFLLTFDDGLSSFYKIVSPILIKKNIPAINFLNTNFINNQKLFYRFKVSILIHELLRENILSEIKTKICQLLNIKFFKRKVIVKWLLKCTIKETSILDKLSDILEVSFVSILSKELPYMHEENIRNLIKNGFCFGSHSDSHLNYNLLNLEEQLHETLKSANHISNIFELDYKLFSFPFSDDGVSKEFFYEMKRQQVISFGSSGLKDEKFDSHFQRIPMEYSRNYSAKKIIRGEMFYYMIKKIFGLHIIERI